MTVRLGIALLVVTIAAASTAQAQLLNCRAFADPAKRLECYDAARPPVSRDATPATPDSTSGGDGEIIARAKASVKMRLRNPGSGLFQSLIVRTTSDGSKAVCGTVDARNDTDGMTGPKPFAYDQHDVYIVVASDGADNGTTDDGTRLRNSIDKAVEVYDKLCK